MQDDHCSFDHQTVLIVVDKIRIKNEIKPRLQVQSNNPGKVLILQGVVIL